MYLPFTTRARAAAREKHLAHATSRGHPPRNGETRSHQFSPPPPSLPLSSIYSQNRNTPHTLVLEHVSPATRLLEKRRQMFEVQESLEAQKQEFQRCVRKIHLTRRILGNVPGPRPLTPPRTENSLGTMFGVPVLGW